MTTDKFLSIALFIIALFLLGVAVHYGVTKQERNECLEWHNQSQIYENWTVADWQVAQCRQYGIQIKN